MSTEIIKSQLTLELSKEGIAYQKLLQECENITFSKDNLNQDYLPLKKLREAKAKLDVLKNPFTKDWQEWNAAKKSISNPVETILKTKTDEFTKLANEVSIEKQREETEKQRIKTIKDTIDTFLMNKSVDISTAETAGTILQIERAINLETSYKAKYQEFLPELIERSAEIRRLIKEQKEKLKKLDQVKKDKELALSNNDDSALEGVLVEEEAITDSIKETQNIIQETSINQSLNASVFVGESQIEEVKARRTVIDWEVVDIALLAKKRPDWVNLTVNSKLIGEFVKKQRDVMEKMEQDDITVYGLRIFMKKLY